MLISDVKPFLHQRFPITLWLPKYNKQDAFSDLIAGVTVGLTLMPQAIAYAALAGLEPQYGLYSGCAGILMYVIFGSTKQITIGPTALLSLLTYNYTHNFGEKHNSDLVVLFTCLVGVIELACGILHLGCFVNFVSNPVISGFTSAAAIIIASAQLKNLFGLKYNAESFLEIWKAFFEHFPETKLYDAMLGFTCIVILSILKKLNGINCDMKELNSCTSIWLRKVLWIVTTGRNALVVVLCSLLSYYYKEHLNITPFTLTGNIVSGLPSVKIPSTTTVINGTEVNFYEMVSHLGSGLFVLPLIAIISNLALAKAFSNGGQVDATQEMIALGICNIVGSFVQSMPVASSFSRSAVNNSSGVKTTFGSIYTSILVVLTLTFLTPYFYFIPKASLASVIMTAVLSMIDYGIIINCFWSVHKYDLFAGFITFVCSLLVGVEIGLVIGILIDILFILFKSTKPTVSIEKRMNNSNDVNYWAVLIKYDVIMFPAVDHIKSVIFDNIINKNNKDRLTDITNLNHMYAVVIDCLHVKHIDYTANQRLNSLLTDLRKYNIQLYILINNRDLVVSLSKLCPDMKVVMSYEDLELSFKRFIELDGHNCSNVRFQSDTKQKPSKSYKKNNKISVINIAEDTRC